MSSELSEDTILLLKDFVERNSHIAGIHWDQRLKPKLLVNPFSSDYEEKRKAAHFFLFMAALSETRLIERAECARHLLVHLHEGLGNRLFELTTNDEFRDKMKNCGFYEELGSEKEMIPDVLASVNLFIKQEAGGDLIDFSRRFSNPEAMMERISKQIERMGGLHAEKSWMYMRWMVRPAPDLGIFKHFSPADLAIPLTTDIANVAVSLGLMPKTEPSFWEDEQSIIEARNEVTRFAKTFFPQDPAKADYPFFLLGRWMKGMDLTEATLSHCLQLFDNVYKLTGYSCVDYQILAFVESGWEELLKENMTKMKIRFSMKPYKFPLPENLVYTPDFILTDVNVKGKKIVLEPHGRMNEEEIHKFSLFRQVYGKDCYLLLIMRNEDIVYYRARGLLPEEAYDDVWPKEYLGMLLTKLKTAQYKPLNS